jgi:hypothetical protein
MNKDRNPKKVLNMKVKGICPRGSLISGWEQQVRKRVMQKEGRPLQAVVRQISMKIRETCKHSTNIQKVK